MRVGVGALLWLCLVCTPFVVPASEAKQKTFADEILRQSGVKGGLIVHLGCRDGTLTAALRRSERFLVHGLSPDPERIARAREMIRSRGLCGNVSVARHDLKRLPYAENLVNLVVADDLPSLLAGGLSLSEVMRVLVPNGVAIVGQRSGASPSFTEDKLKATLTGAGVKDFEVCKLPGVWASIRKPLHMDQRVWREGTHYADGNAVYPDASGPFVQLQWIAGPDRAGSRYRNAEGAASSNGRVFYIFVEPASGNGGGGRHLIARDAFNGMLLWKHRLKGIPPLVAVGDRVYTGRGGSVMALDAATGEVVVDFKTGGGTLIYHEDRLIVAGNPVKAFEARTGKPLWTSKARAYGGLVAVGDGRILLQGPGNPRRMICLAADTGKTLWDKPGPQARHYIYHSDTLIMVLQGGFCAYSAKDGRPLWNRKEKKPSGHPKGRNCAFVADGLVWLQESVGSAWFGVDPASGEEKKRLTYAKRMQPRCSPAQATKRYFIDASNALLERATGKLVAVPAARSGCSFGYLPANGMIYSVPNACGCFPMLRGFMGFAPAEWRKTDRVSERAEDRIEKGPAFKGASGPKSDPGREWPSLRHDAQRSGSTLMSVEGELERLWQVTVGPGLTGPVIAGGIACVASSEAHRVDAYDAATGKLRWRFAADARVDAPPTIHDGKALFSSRDGWVYCLRASDGVLAWRFRAAPEERYITAHGQLESSWPLYGGVLVKNGAVFCAAGRTSELEGGIRVHSLDPESGDVLKEMRVHGTGFHGGLKTKGSGIVLNQPLLPLGDAIVIHAWKHDLKSGKGEIRERSRPWSGFSSRVVSGPAGVFRLYASRPKGRKDVPPKHGLSRVVKRDTKWSVPMPGSMSALMVAGSAVFVGGPDHAPGGPKGGVLLRFSAADGKPLGKHPLSAPPVANGLAAANGRLYVSLRDGKLACFGKK